jgi:Cytochrome c
VLFNEHGGAEWTGAAYNPRTAWLYVSVNEIPWYITVFRDDEPAPDPLQPPTAGAQIFQTNCAQCHGPDRRGLSQAPPLIGLRHRKTEAEVLLDFLFLRDRPNATLPAGSLPRWTFGDRQKLVDDEGYAGCTPPWGSFGDLHGQWPAVCGAARHGRRQAGR